MKNNIDKAIRRQKASTSLSLIILVVLVVFLTLWEWNLIAWIIAAFLFFEIFSMRREILVFEEILKKGKIGNSSLKSEKASAASHGSDDQFEFVQKDGDEYFFKEVRSGNEKALRFFVSPKLINRKIVKERISTIENSFDSFLEKLHTYIKREGDADIVEAASLDQISLCFFDDSPESSAEVEICTLPDGRILACAYDGSKFYNLGAD